ncbi:MAG: uroporphyrinogen decarboxylase family protein [Opitutaceae bacterium]|nr:uroporphyrinogen decarboxylase family protein [Opitutaceae bacterium]
MFVALRRGIPDRLPVTIHQWQPFHLREFMQGLDQLEAFRAVGLDASIMPPDVWRPGASPRWRQREEDAGRSGHERLTRYRVETPDGELSWVSAANEYTTFVTEHIIKTERDAEIFLKYWPDIHLDQARLAQWYDRTGDDGIVRGFVASFAQPGAWQEFCEMVGTQEAILWAIDHPEFVHHFIEEMTRRKIEYVRRELPGAKFDLIEHGGGAASSTVISPAMFDEFCVPYDRRIIAALHEVGLPVVYHTCGGMRAILDHIPANGCDASETLSPPGVGGDIGPEDRLTVKHVLGSKVALIGGIDQGNLLTNGTPAQIAAEVRACFETFGREGGYICSASDHFFHAPVANLRALAAAGRACRY